MWQSGPAVPVHGLHGDHGELGFRRELERHNLVHPHEVHEELVTHGRETPAKAAHVVARPVLVLISPARPNSRVGP